MIIVLSVLIVVAGSIGVYYYIEYENSKPKFGEITRNTSWKGEISVIGDIRVMEGVTLTVEPGTTINIAVGGDVSKDRKSVV